MISGVIDQLIRTAIEEDSGHGDATSDRIFEYNHMSEGAFIAKESGILAGTHIVNRVFELIDSKIKIDWYLDEGHHMNNGDIIARIYGRSLAILKGERIALNLMQRMCGIASLTHIYVNELKGINCRLVDTRKTTPGLRALEKYAVTVGGGLNHRYNLSDAIMIKDNHIKGIGGIKKAVSKVKASCPHTMKIEVEIEKISQLEEAIEAGADIVMLDNMSLEDMSKAVTLNNGRIILEASGNVSLETVRSIAETGVDVISCGKLTHSVSALDISLKF